MCVCENRKYILCYLVPWSGGSVRSPQPSVYDKMDPDLDIPRSNVDIPSQKDPASVYGV